MLGKPWQRKSSLMNQGYKMLGSDTCTFQVHARCWLCAAIELSPFPLDLCDEEEQQVKWGEGLHNMHTGDIPLSTKER